MVVVDLRNPVLNGEEAAGLTSSPEETSVVCGIGLQCRAPATVLIKPCASPNLITYLPSYVLPSSKSPQVLA